MTQADARPDPEDVNYSASAFWVLCAAEATGALVFTTALPWWKPLTWFVLVAGSGVWRFFWRVKIKALPREQQRWNYRWSIWLRMGLAGSAWYFLYTPGNFPMLALLALYLVATGAITAMRTAGDFTRTQVSVMLVLLPSSLRFLIEGIQDRNAIWPLGAGGILTAMAIMVMARHQERAVTQQFDLRQRAERAAEAVAATLLAKSRFFAAVSHDLRQPVHAIGLYLNLLTHEPNAPQSQQAIDGIRQAWHALDGLLSQVLDLTRSDSGVLVPEMAPVSLAPLLRDLVTQHSSVAERAGVRMVSLVKEDAFAHADELMLKRVVSNLLDNAIKFSPEGATVLVVARRAGLGWRLQVRDAGKGIALHQQAMVFEEFVQLNNSARDRLQGLGLGLAIARRFARLMGGDLQLRSAPGKGTCMTLTLHRLAAPALRPPWRDSGGFSDSTSQAADSQALLPGPARASAPLASLALAGLGLVLLVEDDALVMQSMQMLLQSWGLQVVSAGSAEEGRQQAAHARIAICDVRLPGGASGLALAVELRQQGLKVLLITGESDAATRDAALAQSLVVLIKPVGPQALHRALQGL